MTRKITPAQLDEIEAVAKDAAEELDPATTLALIAGLREAEAFARVVTEAFQAKCDRLMGFAGLSDDDDVDMEAVEEMVAARIEKVESKVRRVREIHEPIDALLNPGRHERVVKVCIGCGTDDGNWQRWPCPTIRALDAN